MSVINSVLRDLDSRPSVFTNLEIDQVTEEKSRSKRDFQYGWLALLLIVITFFAYWYQQRVGFQPESFLESAAPELLEEKSAAASLSTTVPLAETPETQQGQAAAQPVSSNQISGLQIRENDEFMELEFQLTGFASSYLKQRSNNRYVFVIKGVTNAISTPLISDSPWLKQIQILAQEDDIEIQFDTQQGVLVDTQGRRKDSDYYWLIRLKKSLATETAVVAKNTVAGAVLERAEVIQVEPTPVHESTAPGVETDEVLNAPVKLKIRPVQNKPSAQIKLNDAINFIKSGELDKAKAILEGLLGSEFDHNARTYLLSLLNEQQDVQRFKQLLKVSLQKYPGDVSFKLYEANQLFAEKQYLALIDRFKTVTNNPSMISLLATSYQRTQQHQLAAEYFTLALKINAQQPRLWIGLAISQQHLSLREQALSSYQTALRSGSMSPRLKEFVQSKIKQLAN